MLPFSTEPFSGIGLSTMGSGLLVGICPLSASQFTQNTMYVQSVDMKVHAEIYVEIDRPLSAEAHARRRARVFRAIHSAGRAFAGYELV